MIKIISFDLGGVLFKYKYDNLEMISKILGYDKEIVGPIFKSKHRLKMYNEIGYETKFWEWAKSVLPQDYDTDKIKKIWYEHFEPDEDIISLIKSLKPDYKIFCFSGNIPERVEYLDNKFHFRQFFDKEVFSFDYGCNKIDLEFIDVLIREAGVKPEEILIIEDLKITQDLANKAGVQCLLYKSGEIHELRKSMRQLGIRV